MGWTMPYNMPHRRNLIAERVEAQKWDLADGSKMSMTALRHCYIGGRFKGTLYIVWERTRTRTDGIAESTRFIEIDLLEYWSNKGNWAYKDMDCCMGPSVNTCPPAYLALCPPHSDNAHTWCNDWHSRCKEYWKARRIKRLASRE